MSLTQLEELVKPVAPKITKKSRFREPIGAEERLSEIAIFGNRG